MNARLAIVLVLATALNGPRLGGLAPAQNPPAGDGVRALLQRIERIALEGNPAEYMTLLSETADKEDAQEFLFGEIASGATRVVVRERDREPLLGTLPGNGYVVSVDVFTEFGTRARSASWRLEVKRSGDAADEPWRIGGQRRISLVDNLYRLSLNPAKQFTVRELAISAEDIDLSVNDGSAFVAESNEGVTGLVLLGRGEMRFHPAPEVEKGQLKIFSGAETLQTRFDAVFIRLNPQDFNSLVNMERLTPRTVDPRELRRAEELFREEIGKSFGVDMTDMSRELWSLTPGIGDIVAEVHTARYDTLTYVRAGAESEDISFFDRKRHRNISVYSSKRSLARHGRSPSEDDFVGYDVMGYDIDVAVTPERLWIEGTARVHIRVRAPAVNSLTLRLAESLTLRSVVSDRFGRLLAVRVRGQNTVLVNLPATLLSDDDLLLTVAYGGRLEPQREDPEAIALAGQGRNPSAEDMAPQFLPERNYLYSNRSYWYPQSPVTDYATATMRVSVPTNFDCVGSGELDPEFPRVVAGPDSQPRKVFLFTATQPLRYLAFVISRFVRLEPRVVSGGSGPALNLLVQANPRQVRRGRELAERAADIAQFYRSIVGDYPYPTFTLAVVESDLPGGHSPGYFAALNQPLPTSPWVWRNDPAAFEDFPDFFLAHELAHQWWGHAVGWRNYHEQWLSEGFAQYFAALYAQRQRGDDTFAGMLRQFRRFAVQYADQGPIYLGYRLGHIRGESRVFRSIVYNKSAAVLHMLRRLVGDEPFFKGVRRFYEASRYQKAGTEDFRAAMEAETGRPLERFFEQWIYGSALPRLKLTHRVESAADGPKLVVHVEQVGEVFDVPLTLTLIYADKREATVVIPVRERTADTTVPLSGTLRSVEVSRDDGSLADVVKN